MDKYTKYPALQYKAENIPHHMPPPLCPGTLEAHWRQAQGCTLQGKMWGVRPEITGLICSEKGSGEVLGKQCCVKASEALWELVGRALVLGIIFGYSR